MERLKINEKLSISLVDFGGQRVFGAVHGLFMNRYGIYLLCFSMASWLSNQQQCEKDIKMWVNSVVVYTGTINDDQDLQPAPILLVGTHKDQVADVAVHRRISDSIMLLFGDRHPMWKNLHENDKQKLVFFPVDNTQGTGHFPFVRYSPYSWAINSMVSLFVCDYECTCLPPPPPLIIFILSMCTLLSIITLTTCPFSVLSFFFPSLWCRSS